MKNVIIIGAGPAGLTAAYELLKHSNDYNVTILEESSAIGGIARTVSYKGNLMDLGGHRFISRSERVIKWWLELMSDSKGRHLLKRKRLSRIYYNGKLYNYPVSLSLRMIKDMGVVTAACVLASYIKALILPRKEDTLEDFYINHFGKKLYLMFFKDYTRKVWGRHPSRLSPDWGIQRTKGLSISTILTNFLSQIHRTLKSNLTSMDSSKIYAHSEGYFLYPKYGPGELWEYVASDIISLHGNIMLASKVTGVELSDHQIKKVNYLRNGNINSMEADIVISSMPLKDMLSGIPSVPPNIIRIAKALPYRDYVIVGILADKTKLTNKAAHRADRKNSANINNLPDNWIYIQERNIEAGRIQIYNNWSPALTANSKDTVWLGLEYFCQENDECWNRSEAVWEKTAGSELIKMGLITDKDAILDIHCERIKKAYPAYYGGYKHIEKIRAYLDKIENLYCIGRNGQHRYNNMDHSMLTAFEAVDNILSGRKSRVNIWNVNTQKEYNEGK